MDMNTPIGTNALDANGVVGKPLDRVDGRLKVTGGARYAYEMAQGPATAYGYVVQAAVGKGLIRSIDTSAAERAPGVHLVLTYRNAPAQGTGARPEVNPVLTGPEVAYHGQPVAFVVAETFEQARAAAYLVRVDYDRTGGDYTVRGNLAEAQTPKPGNTPPDSAVGNFAGAFAAAAVQLDVTYTTPLQSHAMMEPHATLALWDGDKLILHTANQMLNRGQSTVARTLKMPIANVRLISPFIGGGFGAKLAVEADAILAAIAARQLQRPVKIALTRQQVFAVTTHRSDTIQHIRIGTDHTGHIVAIGHDVVSGNLRTEPGFEAAAAVTRTLYAGANRLTRHKLVPLDIPVASSMRAPGEAVGLLALECAMDELAEKLALDPIELRVRNEPTEDPEKHIPYSSRHLIPCLQERRAPLRLVQAQRQAGPGAGWPLARGHGGSGGLARQPVAEVERQRAAGTGRGCRCAHGDDRYRHRHLHHPYSDRRRNAWFAAGAGARRVGRYGFSLCFRFGRVVWCRQFRIGPVRGLHGVARQAGSGGRDGPGCGDVCRRKHPGRGTIQIVDKFGR